MFGEEIGQIDGCVDTLQMEEVPFNPFTQGEVFDVNVPSPRGWFLGIAHGGASIVIFVEDCGCFLWNIQIPKNTSDEEYHLACVVRSHEFGFRR